MNENDKSFHKLQLQDPPTGYCSTFVDKKWKKTQERKESRLNRSRSEYYDFFTPERSDENQSQNVVDDMEVDPTYQVEESPQKKMKYQYLEESTLKNSDIDDMPYRFRHIRNGVRSVRPEISDGETQKQIPYVTATS